MIAVVFSALPQFFYKKERVLFFELQAVVVVAAGFGATAILLHLR